MATASQVLLLRLRALTCYSSISIPAARKVGIRVENMGSVREIQNCKAFRILTCL